MSSLRCRRSTLILIFHGKTGAYRENGVAPGLLGAPGRNRRAIESCLWTSPIAPT